MFCKTTSFVALAVLVCVRHVSADPIDAELAVNGGFEDPTVVGTIFQGQFSPLFDNYQPDSVPRIPGWTVVAGDVDIVVKSDWGWPFEGTQFLDLNGWVPGTIEQSLPTTPGVSYRVTFRYSSNPANTHPTTGIVSVIAEGGQVLLNDVFSHPPSTASNMDYTLFESQFVANSANSILRFESPNLGHAFEMGPALDAVSVTVIPEPTSLIMLTVAGLSLLAIAWRRRRRAAAFLIAGVILLVGVGEVWANSISGVLASHSGANDPATEGWTLDGDGTVRPPTSAILNDEGLDAWVIDDDITNAEGDYRWFATPEEVSAAMSNGWRFSSRVKSGDVPDVPDYGVYFDFGDGSRRFVVDIGSDADADPVVRLTADSMYTAQGLGGGYHLYQMEYDPQVSLATVSVDGVVLTDSYAGFTASNPRLRFGSGWNGTGEGRWNMVKFEIIPEPGSTALLLCGAFTLLGFAWRKKRSKTSTL